jgi:biotin synthase
MSTASQEIVIAGTRFTVGADRDWSLAEVEALYALPFNDLLYAAQWVHRQTFDPNTVQISTLLSIKTGACPEDCAYCPQSIRYQTKGKSSRQSKRS